MHGRIRDSAQAQVAGGVFFENLSLVDSFFGFWWFLVIDLGRYPVPFVLISYSDIDH